MQKRKKMKNRRIYEWKVREKKLCRILYTNFKHDKLKKQKFKQLLTRTLHTVKIERERNRKISPEQFSLFPLEIFYFIHRESF